MRKARSLSGMRASYKTARTADSTKKSSSKCTRSSFPPPTRWNLLRVSSGTYISRSASSHVCNQGIFLSSQLPAGIILPISIYENSPSKLNMN